jgi:monothiol glutaredoxin
MSDSKKISLPILNNEDANAAGPKTRAEGGDVMTELKAEVSQHAVVLFMKGTPAQPMCGFSAKAAGILDTYGIPYHTVNILTDPEKRQAIKVFSDWPTIPQIYVDGEFLGGSDILTQMYENGQLDDVMKTVT